MYENCDTNRSTLLVSEPEKWVIYKKEMEQLEKRQFEDIQVAVPKDYDAVLKRNYNNYMELPPQEERVNHVPVEVQFPGEETIILKK